jgi:hypothetical protein
MTVKNDGDGSPFADWMKMWTKGPTVQNPQQAAFQQMMGAWQEQTRQAFEHFATNDEFLGAVGKQLTGSFMFKEQLDDAMERQLEALRVPTASDVKALRRRMRGLDDRLEDISEQIEALHEAVRNMSKGTEGSAQAVEAAKLAAGAAIEAGKAAATAAEAARAVAASVSKKLDAVAPDTGERAPRTPKTKTST